LSVTSACAAPASIAAAKIAIVGILIGATPSALREA
jgi:hypothetical protein